MSWILLCCCLVPHDTVLVDTVEWIQLAHVHTVYYDSWGGIQLEVRSYWIFWDWDDGLASPIVMDWRKYRKEVPSRQGDHWILILRDKGSVRKIIGKHFEQQDCLEDPELVNGTWFPSCLRRHLRHAEIR